MKHITRIETFDGETHPNEKDAQRHLDNLFGEYLCALARKVTQTGKYKDALDILETEIGTMRTLVQIHDDMKLEREEE